MTEWGVDLGFAAVITVAGLAAAFSGAVRACVMAVGVVLAGLLAMNFYEPLSDSIVHLLRKDNSLARYGDFVSLLALFITGVMAIRMINSRLLRDSPELPPLMERIAAFVGGFFVGGVVAAVLLTSLHTFPGSRDFGGYFRPEPERRTGPIARWGPDVCWLGFTQHVSENVFRVGDGQRVFDGPRLDLGEHNDRWPTFPYRYARWRARLSGE